ncbi:ExeM/NucH family extracellular endonuclease [Aliiglaciecola sp. CAU 1673]|uniref:ExeM/NucH family extracellular endonuclease n=1 Tax=Aliiglaciecola sp. CAU 1673 TaxID=3032595 RepID=UPI0023DA2F91|nr:ExeM/NucH family extracellular endonuclease [Aliiglaciecola sp. CAU 1673]MDF2178850.1 ExeM/NucH family extracellular endonuclease [Aliiglaciecola sp. CAU 1673]
MKTKLTVLSAAILASMHSLPVAANNLILTGVIDGPLTGGVPKAIEIFVPQDIADLSRCGVGSANNGGGTDGQEYTFPAVAVSAGTFLYVASESTGFTNFFGFAPDFANVSAVNVNGDDAIELFCDGAVVDTFGEISWASSPSWAHTDGWVYRVSDTGADGSEFVPSNWEFSGKDALDGQTDNASAVIPFPSKTFTIGTVDPEPVVERLIFSEYVEGAGGNNKAIELYNAGTSAIDLSSYQVLLYINGSTTAGTTLSLSGSLEAGQTYVIANSGSIQEILDKANITSGVTNFNGNDVLELRKDGELVDSFGQVGNGADFAKDVSLVRNQGIITGDTDSSNAFSYSDEWTNLGTNVFSDLGRHHGDDSGEPPVSGLGQCGDSATLISAIQGEGDASPLLNQSAIVEAVVTASFPNLRGYFVQEEAADQDANGNTSEGLFVYTNSSTGLPVEGTLVRVMGNVAEFYNKTQLAQSEAALDCGAAAVSPAVVSLPFANASSAEALEGMLVTFEQNLTVTDNYNLGRYGEVTLSNGRVYIPTNLHLPGSAEAQALAAQNTLNRILLDDGVSGQNPVNVIYPTGGLSASNTLRTGDMVTSLTGVVDYNFNEYRVVPTQAPTFVQANARTAAPELAQGNLKIASLNVLNFFNGDGQGGGFPTARGADTAQEYTRQLDKLVSALVAMDADIIGLMEIENDGYGGNSAIAQLVAAVNARLGEARYAFVNAGGPIGTDAIAVGMLYDTTSVELVGNALINTDAVFSRPPLAQRFLGKDSLGELTVAVNHFKSKGCGGASGADQDQNDGQGCYNASRVAQAQTLTAWLQSEPSLSKDKDQLIIGDLNAYAKEDPIMALGSAGFTNLISEFVGATGYSYVFGGQAGYLDHALASSNLLAQVLDVTEWHINADEPRILDYNTEFKSATQVNDFYAPDAYRVSDHDPVIISLQLNREPVRGDWDGDYDVDRNDVNGLIRAIAKKEQIDMAFDLNEDGIVNVKDAQVMMSLCNLNGCRVL